MKHAGSQAMGEKEIRKILDSFFATQMREHSADGKTSVQVIEEIFEEAKKLTEWGKLVMVPSVVWPRKSEGCAYQIAAAFQMLVLCVVFQEGVFPESARTQFSKPRLSVTHFPAEQRAHAEASIRLVLGDTAMAHMYQLVLSVPAQAKTVLALEEKFKDILKDVFSYTLRSKADIFEYLFIQGVGLGCDMAHISATQKSSMLSFAKKFYHENKKEPAFANSFLNTFLAISK